jgi:hypothetical protein
MINCPKCNAVLSDDTKICPYCVYDIQNASNKRKSFGQTINDTQQEVSAMKIIMFFMVFFIISTAFFFITVMSFKVNTSYKEVSTTKLNALTLEKVVELSKEGYALTWRHFDDFDCREDYYEFTNKQSKVCIAHYPYTFELWIEGKRGSKPEKILLVPDVGGYYNNVDLRKPKEVEKFIEKNKSGLVRE